MSVAEIDAAISTLFHACGFRSESDTERMFWVLYDATEKVREKWELIEQSHREGLCYNVNAMLSDAIAEELGNGRGEVRKVS